MTYHLSYWNCDYHYYVRCWLLELLLLLMMMMMTVMILMMLMRAMEMNMKMRKLKHLLQIFVLDRQFRQH